MSSSPIDETVPVGDVDLLVALDSLLADVGMSAAATGGAVTFAGKDPILNDKIRLGAAIGLPIMAAAVTATALWRHRTGETQDLHLDLRQAIYGLQPEGLWHPTINGEPAPKALIGNNPFTTTRYRTRDGRTVMASGVYPRQEVQWCQFLDVPPSRDRIAAAIALWDAADLEDGADAVGLPVSIARTPQEWIAHPQGVLLARSPVIGLQRTGDAPPRVRRAADRPLDGVRVLSFTHAIAGPVVGRTLAEQGADVLCATRPDDYEHEFIYDGANVGSRSAYIDLTRRDGQATTDRLLHDADVVVSNFRPGKLDALGLDARRLATDRPGIVTVELSCYGSSGPWGRRGGFDMNGSAASGLMVLAGSAAQPRLPSTRMINDYVTGYLGAAGAAAALYRQATEGGSWRVTVNLTRCAMWAASLGTVDPAEAGGTAEHRLGRAAGYDADTPLGPVHMLAPPVVFSRTPARWRDPILVPRGSSSAEWRSST